MKNVITRTLIIIIALVLIAVIPVAAITAVPAGGTVFRGEEGLDIVAGMPGGAGILGWYAAGSTPVTDAPSKTMSVTNSMSFYVDPSMDIGAWYEMPVGFGSAATIIVADPSLDVKLIAGGNIMNDKTITKGEVLRFRIDTNLDAFTQRSPPSSAPVRIRVTDPEGAVFTSLIDDTGTLINVAANLVNANPFFVTGSPGSTGVWDTGNANYDTGTYTYRADCNANRMNDNYDVTGKTVSKTYSVRLSDEPLTITSSKTTTLQGESFAVTINGRPSTAYVLWVEGTSELLPSEVPSIKDGLQGVQKDSQPAAAYIFSGVSTVGEDVPQNAAGVGSVDHYALVYTNGEGRRTVSFQTSLNTREDDYTIRTDRLIVPGPSGDSAQVQVTIKEILSPPDEMKIPLLQGWNFISTPKRLAEGNNTAAIFSLVDTGGRSIFLYNAGDASWVPMNATSPFLPLEGIWIYSNTRTDIPLLFDSGAVQTPPSKVLSPGWNAVGFSGLEPATARDALISVQSRWTQTLGWNGVMQRYDTAIVTGGSGAFSDSRLMYPMQGYWVFMTDGGILAALG
jgi:hypothetical protein